MELEKCRILVTPTSYGKDDDALKIELEKQVGEVIYNPSGRPLSSDEVRQLLPGVDGYIAGLDEINQAAIESADRLKVISRYGVGIDRVDLEAARKKGITVTNTPGANSASVAELALSFMLVLARHIPEANKAVHRGEWPRLAGISLEGKTVGIIGFGAIGKELARRLAGFGCIILAHDPFVDKKSAKSLHVKLVDLEDLAQQSDFISLHVPLVKETKGFINKEFITTMKKGAFLINTSRGEVLNEDDLLEALKNGHIKGAALDTFANEPPDAKHPLLSYPQVIATPHIGAQTDGAASNMGWMAMRDCLAVLKGDEPLYQVA